MKAEVGGMRPYHHGDLRRGLIDAARRLLECEGLSALSLRAVAREAGVSPAAPYYHFKDKNELLGAIADQGWGTLKDMLKRAVGGGGGPAAVGVAYVRFARDNPALYRVMYDRTRERDSLPEASGESAYHLMRQALIDAGADPRDRVGLELASVAAWTAAHGLAEMAGFRQFEPLIDATGGEEAFLLGVMQHLGVFAHAAKV